MKKLLLLTTLITSGSVFAAEVMVEMDEATEMKCFTEAKRLGCADKSDSATTACLVKKKDKLSPTCRDLLTVRGSH